jgi:hypothetical protein
MDNTLNTTLNRFRRIAQQARKVAQDISYLERRKLELQTGLSFTEPRRF